MIIRVTATTPQQEIDNRVEAPNAFLAVDGLRVDLFERGFHIILDEEGEDHCRGRIYSHTDQGIMPVGQVEARQVG